LRDGERLHSASTSAKCAWFTRALVVVASSTILAPKDMGGPVGRYSGIVAVDETGRTVGAIPFEQTADLAHRMAKHAGRLGCRVATGQDVIEDEEPVLHSGVPGDRLPRFVTIEGDEIAGRRQARHPGT
jgi:hypothetical protein